MDPLLAAPIGLPQSGASTLTGTTQRAGVAATRRFAAAVDPTWAYPGGSVLSVKRISAPMNAPRRFIGMNPVTLSAECYGANQQGHPGTG